MKSQPLLDKLFYPASIAVIDQFGNNPTSRAMVGELLKCFDGELHYSNNSLMDIPNPVEVVIFIGSESFFAKIYLEAVEKGVAYVIALSDLSYEAINQAKEGLTGWLPRVCGGSSSGIANINWGIKILSGTFLNISVKAGSGGLISMDDQLASKLINIAGDQPVGFSMIASLGREADLSAGEVLKYYINSPEIKVVYLVLASEASLNQLKELVGVSALCKKPIIAMKLTWSVEEKIFLEKNRISYVRDPWEMINLGKVICLDFTADEKLGLIYNDKVLGSIVEQKLAEAFDESRVLVMEEAAGFSQLIKAVETWPVSKIIVVWEKDDQCLGQLIGCCGELDKDIIIIAAKKNNKYCDNVFYFEGVNEAIDSLKLSARWNSAANNSHDINNFDFKKSSFLALSQVACMFDGKLKEINNEKARELLKFYKLTFISQEVLASCHFLEPERAVELPFRFNLKVRCNLSLGPIICMELLGLDDRPIKKAFTIAPIAKFEVENILNQLGVTNTLEIMEEAEELANLILNVAQFATDIEQYAHQIKLNNIRIFPKLRGIMVKQIKIQRREETS